MKPEDIIVIAILLVITVGVGIYIYRAKRRGQKCIGCPYSKECSGNCHTKNSSSSES